MKLFFVITLCALIGCIDTIKVISGTTQELKERLVHTKGNTNGGTEGRHSKYVTHKTSVGGATHSAQEEKSKKGEELKEHLAKKYGENEGGKIYNEESNNKEKDHKKHKYKAHYKTDMEKGKKKANVYTKGFNDKYHKDEEKSKKEFWGHEHHRGSFFKYGSKKKKKGEKNADKLKKMEHNNPSNKGNEDITARQWSTEKKSPTYTLLTYSSTT